MSTLRTNKNIKMTSQSYPGEFVKIHPKNKKRFPGAIYKFCFFNY